MFNDDEVEVAGNLLELPSLVFAEQTKLHGRASSRFVALSWGCKRKRSDAVEPSSSVEASSLSAPLSFATNESDEKRSTLPEQVSETPLKNLQEHFQNIKLRKLHGKKLLHHHEDMLQNILSSMTTNSESRPEIKYEVQVPPLDLEKKVGGTIINRNEQEPEKNGEQQSNELWAI